MSPKLAAVKISSAFSIFALRTFSVAVAGTIGMALVSTSASATLDATSFNTTAQSINSGTLILDAPLYPATGGTGSGAGFNTAVSGMKPGDVIHRFVTYKNSGTMAGQTLKLWIADTATTLLTTDATNGLKVVVSKCATAWTWASPTATAACSGGATSWLATTALSTIKTEANAVSFAGSPTLAANETVYLKFDIQLPDRVERRANAGTPTDAVGGALTGGTIQGLTANITWTLYEAQATASDTNA